MSLIERAEKQNYARGHALESSRPRGSGMKNMQCQSCGHAIARAICKICFVPLCKRHTVIVNREAYCARHAPGYK